MIQARTVVGTFGQSHLRALVLPGVAVETIQAAPAPGPDDATILYEGPYVAQPRWPFVHVHVSIANACNPSPAEPDPQASVGRAQQAENRVPWDGAETEVIPRHESYAVKAEQSLAGSQPEVPVLVLRDDPDRRFHRAVPPSPCLQRVV